MNYPHILAYMASQFWAMEPKKLAAIFDALCIKAQGGQLVLEGEPDNGGVPYMAANLQARITPGQARRTAEATGSVAILPVRGTLMHRMSMVTESSGITTYEKLCTALRQLVANTQVKAVVLDIHSPGGSTDGILELAADIRMLREQKPIIGSINVQCASAAYWLGSQCSDLAISPSGSCGSIGVFTLHEDFSRWYEEQGITPTLIRAGRYKVEGNPWEPLSDEAREAIQADVSTFHDLFIKDVATGRNVDASVVADTFGQGRMVLAPQALRLGMVDRIATLEETLNRYGASLHAANNNAGNRQRLSASQARRRLNALRAG